MDSSCEHQETTAHGMQLRHVVLDFKKRRPERKSGASYQAEYRNKLKSDSQQWAQYKQRQKQYRKTYLNNLSDEERKARRAKKTERQREMRRTKKLTKEKEPCPPVVNEQHNKKKTRKAVQDSRTYWRERKCIQRASMTPEERKAVNKRENERRKNKNIKSFHSDNVSFPSDLEHSIRTDGQIDAAATCSPPVSSSTPNQILSSQINSTSTVLFSSTPYPSHIAATDDIQSHQVAAHSPSPTKCAKYSSLQRVKKTLPRSKKSKLYIMTKLLKSCSPSTKKNIFDLSMSSQREPNTIPSLVKKRQRKQSLVKEQVVSFYENIALNVPDKRFYSKRLKVQRKVLDRPLCQIYADFVCSHPSLKVSKRNFFKCRPKHILKMKSMKLRQCLCEVCENMQLMFQPFRSTLLSFETVTDALKSTLCPYDGDWASFDCIQRKCNKCGTQSLKEELQAKCCVNSTVTYKYWDHVADDRCKGKKTKLVTRNCSFNELISNFTSHMHEFSLHKFVDKWQRSQFNSLKKSFSSDCTIIVLDYAENYTCNYQNQAQSAYYGLDQVTIHPIVIYTHCLQCMNKKTMYRIYISDDLKHDAHFAHHVLKDTLQSLDSDSTFIIFSDNCISQYKSRLPVYYFKRLAEEYVIERCFFGERHGKSECDSSGGVVKSFLSQSVATGRATLSNAKEIFEYLSGHFQLYDENCSHCSRTFHLINNGSVDRSVTTAELPLLKGIKRLHSFKFLSNGLLATRQLSCFSSPCLAGMHERCTSPIIPNFEEIRWFMKCSTNARRRKVKNLTCPLTKELSVEINKISDYEAVELQNDGDDRGGVHGDEIDDDGREVGEEENMIDCTVYKDETMVNDNVHMNEIIIGCEDGGDQKVDDEDADEEVVDIFDFEVGTRHSETVVGDVHEDAENVTSEEGEHEILDDVHVDEENAANNRRNLFSKKPVRRQLFCSICTVSGNNTFRDFYNDLEMCTSFQEMQAVCLTRNFEDLLINPKPEKLNLDFEAMKLAPPNKPSGYLPNVTISDGNCVPRSLSTLVFGTENHHLEIRCRIIHELVCNKHLYLDKDFLSIGSEIDRNTIISKIVTLSDSLPNIHLSDTEKIFEAEVFDTRLLGRYLGPWQLHAAAQMLKCGIVSLYPLLGPQQNRELFARAFVPLSCNYEDPLYILWTSSRKDMKREHWVANHVVPMVKMFK